MSQLKNDVKDIEQAVDSTVEGTKDEGATMVEYALLAALIAVALIAVVTYLSQSVSSTFSKVGSSLN
jgi:pilus assembly protein Flp/PilA